MGVVMLYRLSFKYGFRYVVILVLFFLLGGAAFSETIQKPFLWELEHEGVTSYLFGTIHFADKRVTTLHPAVEEAFKASDYIYTEVPLDTSDMMAQVSALMLEGDETLTDIVEPELLQRADRLVKNINPALNIQPFLKFKVWAFATSLSLLEQQLKNPGALPLDAMLYQRASHEGKGAGGIETMQEQLSYFENLTQDEELKMLRDTIEFMEQAETQNLSIAEEFILQYLQGNVEALGELMVKYVKDDEFSKVFLRKILHDRNVIMADRIYAKLKKNPSRSYFFAVGAGHYHGETGVQNLLKGKGVRVVRVEE